ncbi:MAG: hypothetical protein KGJ87_05295 [Planctomycetota bacterium]|nr:hypothetical protein [Planctomycetota bacterium]MDE1890585.1 hypothetical protein [Planctomycetota bacterium]MDE2216564.1 hypothetical protein [Planctomycetota bacterium]
MIIYISFLMFFLFGCSTVPNEGLKDIDHRIFEISAATQTLGKKIDDLSKSISLLVKDGNGLHNELEDVKTHSKDIQQNFEKVEMLVKNLNDRIDTLETHSRTLEEGVNKRIEDIQKAEIELSNRLEVIKLDIKEKGKSPDVH